MKKYNNTTKEQAIKMAILLRASGYTWNEIEKKIKWEYPEIRNITSIRKNVESMERYGKGDVVIDGEDIMEAISSAKTDLLINRKINNQSNIILHKLANDEARWQILCDKLDKFKSKPIKLGKLKKNNLSNKDVIYIIGDIHRRGEIDDDLFIDTFTTIKNDIISKKYENVSLWFTGDIIDGEIHEEQQRTNQEVIDNAIEAVDLLIQCIRNTPNISEIRFVYGNHEEVRLWGEKNTKNNVGKFIAWGLEKAFGEYINVLYDEELWFTYKDKDILLLHGHQDYAKSKAKLIEHCDITYGKQPDEIVIGHFHTSKTNQFSKNRWLITAPAVKNWASKWDTNKGYCGLGQIIKLKLNMKEAQITTMNVEE